MEEFVTGEFQKYVNNDGTFYAPLTEDHQEVNAKAERQQAVPAQLCFVYAHACLVLALCYGRPSLVWAVLKLLQFMSLWRSHLFNTGVVAAVTNLRPEIQITREPSR